ncbi:hypothetical protein LCGC14_2559650, partial [marine sediment metagenome]
MLGVYEDFKEDLNKFPFLIIIGKYDHVLGPISLFSSVKFEKDYFIKNLFRHHQTPYCYSLAAVLTTIYGDLYIYTPSIFKFLSIFRKRLQIINYNKGDVKHIFKCCPVGLTELLFHRSMIRAKI